MNDDYLDEAPGLAPPHDLDAERATLGGMLLSPDAATEASAIVSEQDYYDARHATIHRTITTLIEAGEPADVMTVTARLLDSGDLKRLRSSTYISDIAASVANAASTSWYAQRVVDFAARRRLLAAGTKIVQIGQNTSIGTADAVEAAQRELHAATVGRDTGGVTTASELMQSVLDRIDSAGDREGRLRGVSTGLIELDALTGGWQPGQLIIVAGRPGMGKSVFAVDAAREVAVRNGKPALFFSLEMSKEELGDRAAAAESSVPLDSLKSSEMTDAELSKVIVAAAKVSAAPLLIIDTPGQTLSTMRARARRIQQQHGVALICVDYLQLMRAAGRYSNRQEEVSEISRGLKLLAKELHCPVIAAAQLNRGPETRMDKIPLLADLRESGSVENDADMVLLLHRPSYYKKTDRPGEVDIIIAKNRHGATDTITASAQLHFSRFVDHHPDAPYPN